MEIESEREDGEIVDGLEEVSDCSITSNLNSGKSITYQDLITSVSVSSISDSDNGLPQREVYPLPKRRHHSPSHKPRRKRRRSSTSASRYHHHRSKKHRKRIIYTSSDSECEKIDRKTLKQLQEAVRINKSQDSQHNDLQTRIKKMIEPAPEQVLHVEVEDPEIVKLRELALLSSTKIDSEENVEKPESLETSPISDDDMELDSNTEDKVVNDSIEDSELQELRLAALKTAIMQKSLKRKERKKVMNGEIKDELNKENTQDTINTDTKCSDKCNNNKSVDEFDIVEQFIEKTEIIKTSVVNLSDSNNIGNDLTNVNVAKKDQNSSVEEDVDIMRAVLLASMSDKITKKVNVNPPSNGSLKSQPFKNVKKVVKQNSNMPHLKSNINNRHSIKSQTQPTISVKPLIIHLNDESDSDTESPDKSTYTVDEEPKKDVVTENIEKLLKRTRAAFESNEQIITQNQNVNNIVNNAIAEVKKSLIGKSILQNKQFLKEPLKEIVTEKPPTFIFKVTPQKQVIVPQTIATAKQTVPLQKSTNLINNKASRTNLNISVDKSSDASFNKSVVKYMPASKQQEYRLLKQKLRNANNKTKRVRRNSQKVMEHLDFISKRNTKVKINNWTHSATSLKKNDGKTDTKLKTSDTQKFEEIRLQMKGKYKELTPLLQKIDQASFERRKCEETINKLLEELKRARTKLSDADKCCKELVQQLMKSKETIDQSSKASFSKLQFKGTSVVPQITSTPIKPTAKEIKCDISNIENVGESSESQTEKKALNIEPVVESPKENVVATNKIIPLEKRDDICDKTESNKPPVIPATEVCCFTTEKASVVENEFSKENEDELRTNKGVDKNCVVEDIDVNSVNKETNCDISSIKNGVPEYVSPLNNWLRDQSSNDPLATLCPYETFGECKDPECTYKHYS